jgi:hypothetical protein
MADVPSYSMTAVENKIEDDNICRAASEYTKVEYILQQLWIGSSQEGWQL